MRSLLTVAFFAALFAGTLSPPLDYDLWFDLRMGEEIARTATIPHYTSFLASSFRAPYAVNDEWGFCWLAYHIYRAFGCVGLALSLSAAITLLFWITYRSLRLTGLSQLSSLALLVLVFFLMRSRFMPRPQLLTDVFLALQVYLLLRHEQGRKAYLPWSLGLLYAVWANFHAGIAAGLAILATWTGAELVQRGLPWCRTAAGISWRMLAAGTALAVVAAMLRPGGGYLYWYLYDHFVSRRAMMDANLEWQPLTASAWMGGPGIWLGLSLIGFALAARAGKLRLPHLATTAGVFWMAAHHVGALGVLAAVSPPLVASAWVAGCGWKVPDRLTRFAPLALTPVLAALLIVGLQRTNWRAAAPPPRVYPVQAVAYLEHHPVRGVLFNSWHFGGFLVFRRQPAFIHGMTPTFPDQLLFDYLAILRGDPDLTRRYDVGGFLLHYAPLHDVHAGAVRRLWEDPAWELAYFDDVSLLFVPRGSSREPFRAVNPALPDPLPGPEEVAARELDRKLVQDPSCQTARVLRGELFRRQGRYAEAETAFSRAVEGDPRDFRAWLGRGQTRFGAGDAVAAAADLERAVALEPASVVARYNLAVALAGSGRVEQARSQLDRALKADPSFAPAARLRERL
ncbi:MAG: tetratricopeptide repeat protein [Candidatus Eremiobacterota bacterium]